MKIKGIDKFQEKVPILAGKKIFLLPLYVLSIVSFCIFFMIKLYSLPDMLMHSRINPILLSLIPLAGEIILCIVGFTLVYQMWSWKDILRIKYGPLSYQRIFLVGFAGMSFWVVFVITLFIRYWSFSLSFWINSPFRFLAIPLEEYFGAFSGFAFCIRITLSTIFSVLGITTIIRALQTFGMDYMSVIYLYSPEESKIQNHEIYSVIRHPTYAGYLLLSLGGVFFTFTLYSIIFYIILLVGFYVRIRFIEEKELIARFGQSYQEYMKEVPAFFARPTKLVVFFRFLVGKTVKKKAKR